MKRLLLLFVLVAAGCSTNPPKFAPGDIVQDRNTGNYGVVVGADLLFTDYTYNILWRSKLIHNTSVKDLEVVGRLDWDNPSKSVVKRQADDPFGHAERPVLRAGACPGSGCVGGAVAP